VTKFTVHIVAGPTASGKSAHALNLAQDCHDGAVIINADSLQLYDGLPILTAQPSLEDKEKAPHRLYAEIPANQGVTAMDWRRMALTEIYRAHDSGAVPIVVGGTGFYLKSLINGLSPIPEIPNEIRVLSQDLFDRIGIEEFFKQLQDIDPVIAERIDRHNPQRLVRAYEVFAHTRKPLSYWQSLPPLDLPQDIEFKVKTIMPDREVLYQRCDDRFDVMIEQGVVDEVRAFDDLVLAGKISMDCALTHALGFHALQSHVQGDIDLQTAIILAKNETRHYAKRQVTWFRHQMDSEMSSQQSC
jgi:tRNA dimethylallyltransferase